MSETLELGCSARTRTRNILVLIGWIALTFMASATAVFVSTGGWYVDLVKPAGTRRAGCLDLCGPCYTH